MSKLSNAKDMVVGSGMLVGCTAKGVGQGLYEFHKDMFTREDKTARNAYIGGMVGIVGTGALVSATGGLGLIVAGYLPVVGVHVGKWLSKK